MSVLLSRCKTRFSVCGNHTSSTITNLRQFILSIMLSAVIVCSFNSNVISNEDSTGRTERVRETHQYVTCCQQHRFTRRHMLWRWLPITKQKCSFPFRLFFYEAGLSLSLSLSCTHTHFVTTTAMMQSLIHAAAGELTSRM